ncbi:MAG: tetraacyldisaccharide 4'-kinase [Gammaproteobacteria bacterium]
MPLSWLFRCISYFRRIIYQALTSKKHLQNVCIIVVGNLTVGGAGKTPFVSYLAQRCIQKGLVVGVIARGYGREDESQLIEVMQHSKAAQVGDEALMLKHQLSCPIAVAAKRIEAAKYLYDKYQLDVIISDDGLQHYKLPRDYEIIVVDGEREFGNGWCLPAGPLREPVSRLNQANIVVSNGINASYDHQYSLSYNDFLPLEEGAENKTLKSFEGHNVHAVAGIGNPKRFFAALENLGLQVIPHAFPDHYVYKQTDIEFNDNSPIIMTEKDAVKCKQFNKVNAWYLPVSVMPNKQLNDRITNLLEEIK